MPNHDDTVAVQKLDRPADVPEAPTHASMVAAAEAELASRSGAVETTRVASGSAFGAAAVGATR